MSNYKVLIGSPIYKSSVILREFLLSLTELEKKNLDVHYFFIDDNENKDSSNLLK